MQLTRNNSIWKTLVRYGRSAIGMTLLVAGMSTVTQAHNHATWFVPPTHTGSGGSGISQPTPQPSTQPSTSSSSVPEIDASAAVGGLALLFGALLLLRDRALAR